MVEDGFKILQTEQEVTGKKSFGMMEVRHG